MSDSASADLLRLLALTSREPGAAHFELFAALELTGGDDLDTLRAAHTEAFVAQCVPYVSIYVGAEGAIGGEAADRVAGFRRLLGADIDAGQGQAADYLPDLLTDYAELVAMGDEPQARHARKALLWEHLACWLLPFCDALVRAAPAPYAGWAALAARVFRAEAGVLGLPSQLPLHLREAPAWAIGAEAESRDDAARALFVPAATGLVFTRADLARAAATIQAPIVPGSRAFMLRTLLDQDPRRRARLAVRTGHAPGRRTRCRASDAGRRSRLLVRTRKSQRPSTRDAR